MSVDEVRTFPNESSILTTVVGTADPALAVPGWVVKTRFTGRAAVMEKELLFPLAVSPLAEAAMV